MQTTLATGPRRFLRNVGSLWFAAVLLVLVLVAMACATVYESKHGTEQAQKIFYFADWFKVLLGLLGVNVLASLLARYPFTKKQIGFAITHTSIIVILVGALVTEVYSERGQLVIAEGESASEFRGYASELSVKNGVSGEAATVALDADAFGGVEAVEDPPAAPLVLGDLTVVVKRVIPDSNSVETMANTNPLPRQAAEVVLAHRGSDHASWVFAGQTARMGSLSVEFRTVDDAEELARLLTAAPASASSSMGTVKVVLGGATYEFPLQDCIRKVVPIGDTGRTLTVLRYLPHATVMEGKLTSMSNEPKNPAIEVELTGPDGKELRRAFANFPDFAMMHGDDGTGGDEQKLMLTFVRGAQATPEAPITLLLGPEGKFHVRMAPAGGETVSQEVTVGTVVPTPWPGHSFKVTRHFDHARTDVRIEPVDPPRETRVPAVLVALETAGSQSEMWVQKFQSQPLTVDRIPFEIVFRDQTVDLGFTLKLKQFRLGKYPGEERPRSYESDVTITDPTTGRDINKVISMNSPVDHGGYSIFQSSYRLAGMGTSRNISFLSVSRDPGLPVVYVGYFGTMLGMLVVLGTRVSEVRRVATNA